MTDASKPSNETPMESEAFDRGDPKRRCKAHLSNGSGARCRKWAIRGGTTCATHGSSTKNAKRKARERLELAQDAMARELLGLATGAASETVKLAAIKDALDRGGLIAPRTIEVEVTARPWEKVIEDAALESGSRSDYRASVGRPDPAELPHPPDGEDSGIRVLGETFDGNLVIESGPPGSTLPDDEHQAGDVAGGDVQKSRTETLGNVLTPVRLPHGAYLPAEDALEQANAVNRQFRRNLGRQ